MSEPGPGVRPYRVVYSGRVRAELKSLLARAKAAGQGARVLAALTELDQRLRIYPQFGEPVRDLPVIGHTRWVASVGPLFVEYVIDEDRRLVGVVIPLQAMPNAGFE